MLCLGRHQPVKMAYLLTILLSNALHLYMYKMHAYSTAIQWAKMGSWVWLVRSSYCTLASDARQTQPPLCNLLVKEDKINLLETTCKVDLTSCLQRIDPIGNEHGSQQDLVGSDSKSLRLCPHMRFEYSNHCPRFSTIALIARNLDTTKSENGSAAENEAQPESRQMLFSKMAYLLTILLNYAHT